MTLTALLDQLDGVAAQSPVLIVFEVAHWIEPTSLDLLDRTIARVANLPVERPTFVCLVVKLIGKPRSSA